MKYFLKYKLTLLFFAISLGSISLKAQNVPYGVIDAVECVHTGSVKIRWVVSDYTIWTEGNEHGYKIVRLTTYANGAQLTGTAMENSRVTIVDTLRPLPQSQWDIDYTNNRSADLAKNILYTSDDSISSGVDLAAALQKEESQDARHIFALLAAEQDFDVAKSMGLGYEDFTISNSEKYIYLITINTANPDYSDVMKSLTIDATEISSFGAVQGVRATSLVNQIEVSWDPRPTERVYTSFDIERSTDNVNFQKINDIPYMNVATSDETTPVVNYPDSVTGYGTYYYRVRGRNTFGDQGPPSTVVSAQAKPPRLDLRFKIDSFELTSDDGGTVHWASLASSWDTDLQGFKVLLSDKSDGRYEETTPVQWINPADRSFALTGLSPAKYIIVEATDLNGYTYQTPAVLAQMPDDDPPAAPLGLTGEFITSSTAILRWDASPEPDLHGYRIFVSNGRSSEFTQVTTEVATKPQYVYEINPQLMIDSIYFTVLATDHHENNSEHSTVLAIGRPDIIPPSQPVLYKATPTPEGIQLGWRFSSSEDVAKHVVQRKLVVGTEWTEVLLITAESEINYHTNLSPDDITATCHIDDAILERGEYVYRLLAYDDQDNVSSSDIINVRPYDSGLRGVIENINVKVTCEPIDPNNVPNQPAYDTTTVIMQQYESGEKIVHARLQSLVFYGVITSQEYNDLILLEDREIYDFITQRKVDYWRDHIVAEVFIMWKYGPTDRLKDFQIYRSTGGSPIMPYEMVPIEQPEDQYLYQDEEVKSGRRYIYQVMARHQDGGFSELSDRLMVRIPIL